MPTLCCTQHIKWKTSKEKYSSGADAYIGQVRIGSVTYDSMQPKGDPLCYATFCRLPGIKQHLGHTKTADEGKVMLQKAVDKFFELVFKE